MRPLPLVPPVLSLLPDQIIVDSLTQYSQVEKTYTSNDTAVYIYSILCESQVRKSYMCIHGSS